MRRVRLLVAVSILIVAALAVAMPSWSFSDGISGASGQIPEYQRDCQGVEYCIVTPSYCGGCHGSYDDMKQQEGSHPSPQEQVNQLDFRLNGDDEAGTSRGLWEYTRGETFAVEIQLTDARPEGEYNSGGFNLNASAGTLTKWSEGDPFVRITGGMFQHAGTKNENYPLDPNGKKRGQFEDDERDSAGEATHTAAGAEERFWQLRWTAPLSTPPRGVALVMTAMLPNGNGLDDSANSAIPQSEWDWFGFMAPRRILCEEGAYDSFKDCQDAVIDFILPPSPPLNTCPSGTTCPTGTDETDGGDSPSPSAVALAATITLAALWARRARRRPPQHDY